MENLYGVVHGRYVVTTYNGTRHVVDLDARTLTRFGAPGRAWSSSTDFGFGPATIADGETFHYEVLEGVAVGGSLRAVDHHGVWRRSSEIITIEAAADKQVELSQVRELEMFEQLGDEYEATFDLLWVCAHHVAFLPCRRCPGGVSVAPTHDEVLVDAARRYHAGDDAAREEFHDRAKLLYLAPPGGFGSKVR